MTGEVIESKEGSPSSSRRLPAPQNENQRHILQEIWNLFLRHLTWPTFDIVDRKVDATHDIDLFRQLGHCRQDCFTHPSRTGTGGMRFSVLARLEWPRADGHRKRA